MIPRAPVHPRVAQELTAGDIPWTRAPADSAPTDGLVNGVRCAASSCCRDCAVGIMLEARTGMLEGDVRAYRELAHAALDALYRLTEARDRDTARYVALREELLALRADGRRAA